MAVPSFFDNSLVGKGHVDRRFLSYSISDFEQDPSGLSTPSALGSHSGLAPCTSRTVISLMY
jgi:hypothetical protein